MMVDHRIKQAILNGNIQIHPPPESIGPASVDLRLSDTFLMVDAHKTGGVIRMDQPTVYQKVITQKFMLAAKQFVLACTQEVLHLDGSVSAMVSGRSSIGRMGLFVENAGYIDPGFHGAITLELFNANDFPIELLVGRRICQVIFYWSGSGAAHNPYHGKYQGNMVTEGSKIFEDK